MISLHKNKYPKFRSWKKFYEKGKSLKKCKMDHTWKKFFKSRVFSDERFNKIEETLKEDTEDGEEIFPYPELVFNTFFMTPVKDIKVVIIGQDPYHGYETQNGKTIPQATGLSFSVPAGFDIPSSLKSVYRNQLKYKDITFMPTNGDLSFWAIQGCLMLNAALTVQKGSPNSYKDMWGWVTNEVIRYISNECNEVIFLLWGSFAFSKSVLIDQDKHDIIVSSHPSGLSCNKPFRSHPAFVDQPHFTQVNKLLKSRGKKEIVWQTT
jgi:uracil-DNA glycosylase